jgi:hypothetical protein
MAELRERLIPFPCMRAGMRSCGEVRRPTYGVMMRRPVERTGTEREIKKKGSSSGRFERLPSSANHFFMSL